MNYKPVIGLEVHVELKTKSKMFCGCSPDYFGKEPNTHVCPVCLGLPGALPVPNKKAIEWCVRIGLALNCEIPLFSKFDRKNYFYPDLPKGYQISQYDLPFCRNGWIGIKCHPELVSGSRDSDLRQNDKKKSKRIRIRRVHMEEDTGKLIHAIIDGEKVSLIDFNRSGVPLVEIVTEPDFESPSEVNEYLKKLQQIVRYLDVSNADMEKGEMRLEPNISLQEVKSLLRSRISLREKKSKVKSNLPDYKVEVKNINSFRFVEKAINYEIERQREILEVGKTPTQETRGWDEKKQITISQRVKEEAMDYRYFPESDVPPIRWSQSQISNLKSQIPELPDEKNRRFQQEYGLSAYDAEILTREKKNADYFEEAVKAGIEHNINPKQIANSLINKKADINNLLPAHLVQNLITSKKNASMDTTELKKAAAKVLEENKKAVEDYKKGKIQVIGFLIGAVKKEIKKPLNTNQIKVVIENLLKIH